MKNIIVLTFAMVLGSTAMAASNKVCFGSTKNEDTKGIILGVEISAKNITIKTLKGDSYNGTYPSYKTTTHGRDGKTYLEYKGEVNDYQDVIMVDEALLKDSTTGLLQIRARGEGFFNSVFVCKDDNK